MAGTWIHRGHHGFDLRERKIQLLSLLSSEWCDERYEERTWMSTKYRTSRYLLLDSIKARVIFRRRLVTAGKTSAFAGKGTRGFLIDALEQNCQTSCQTLLNFLNIGRNEVSYTTF